MLWVTFDQRFNCLVIAPKCQDRASPVIISMFLGKAISKKIMLLEAHPRVCFRFSNISYGEVVTFRQRAWFKFKVKFHCMVNQ